MAEQARCRMRNLSQESLNVDAFPSCMPYRLMEGVSLYPGANVDWVAVNALTAEDPSKLIDLDGVSARPNMAVTSTEMFTSEQLRRAYESLPKQDRVQVPSFGSPLFYR